jgi:hypothetical protein
MPNVTEIAPDIYRMHGSSFCGDGGQALRDLADVMKDVLDKPSYQFGVFGV